MLTLPIARREMILLARSATTYRARLSTGCVTVVVGFGFCLAYARGGVGGLVLLGITSYFLTLLCMFSGAQTTADTIAKEKREGTLGLLFLTGLRPWQIALGKLAANGAAAFFNVFLTFPLLAMLLILGGVLPGQVLLIALVLLNTLFATACIGLYASTFSREQKQAAGRATGFVMFLWLGVPLLSELNLYLRGPSWLSQALLLGSFNSVFLPTTFGPRFGSASTSPWLNLFCVHLLGWLFFALATWTLSRNWQDHPPEQAGFSLAQWWRRFSRGGARVQKRLRARLLEPNPFLWLASRDRLRFLLLWLITLSIIGLAIWAYFAAGRNPGPFIGLCFGLTIMHRFFVAAGGAAQLLADQEQGTIEMLLSTPLTAQEIVRGQFLASFRQLRFLILLVFIIHALASIMLNQRFPLQPAGIVVAISALLYLLDVYTAIWLAMWGAVTTRNAQQAAGAAFVRLMGIPVFIIGSVTVLIVAAQSYFGIQYNWRPPFVIGAICLVLIGNNLYWLRRARKELPHRLRTHAYRRYSLEEPTRLSALTQSLKKFFTSRENPNRLQTPN